MTDGALGRLLLVCAGGAIGSGLRYLTAVAALRWWGLEFPWGTLVANLVGSFGIGLVMQAAAGVEPVRLFLAAGVMGGFTTYSAFSYETLRLLETGAWLRAALNVGGTTAGCLVLCATGLAVGRLLAR